MACIGDSVQSNGIAAIPLTDKELISKLRPVAGQPLHFTIEGVPENRFRYIPYNEVQGTLRDGFTCYPGLREN